MEVDKIRELVRLVEESQIQELELSNRGETIRISKTGAAQVLPPMAAAAPAAAPPVAPAPAAPSATPAAASKPVREGLREIPSPMVGTFYRASSPEADVFVEIGDVVESSSVVCIVEAMKVMNEIEAEISGRIAEVLVENGQPVEFGQPLFLVEPSS